MGIEPIQDTNVCFSSLFTVWAGVVEVNSMTTHNLTQPYIASQPRRLGSNLGCCNQIGPEAGRYTHMAPHVSEVG